MRPLHVALLSLALGVAAATTVHSQSQPAPLQVGFVDVDRVMGEYRKRQSLTQEFERRKMELQTQFKQRRNQIEEKRDKLATLAEGSEEYRKLLREVDIDALTLKRDQSYDEETLIREHNQRLGLIYREVCNEVRAQAEQRGLAAVYAYDPLPQGFETRMDSRAVIQNRDVLWSDGRLDLSTAVLDALNKSLPPAPSPAPAGGGK